MMTLARIEGERRHSRNETQKRAIAVPTGANTPMRMHRVVIITETEERRELIEKKRDLSLLVIALTIPTEKRNGAPLITAASRNGAPTTLEAGRKDAPTVPIADRNGVHLIPAAGRSDALITPTAGLTDALPVLITGRSGDPIILKTGRNDALLTPTAGRNDALLVLTKDRTDVHLIPINRAILERETTVKEMMHLTTVREKVTVQ